jgi:hypothetical protein
MTRKFIGALSLPSFLIAIVLVWAWPVQASESKAAYTSMAPIEQYMMDRDAEIALARSAAPTSISRNAEVWVLGRHGYEIAINGKNGFACLVDRSWMLPYEDPEFWDARVRLPACLNLPASHFHLLLTFNQTKLALSGLSKTQMSEATKIAFDKHELPLPGPGAMCYMMSKHQNFGPKFGSADPHLMFWFSQGDHVNWGAEFPNSPIDVHQYHPQPITEFAISVSKWSDGTVYASVNP